MTESGDLMRKLSTDAEFRAEFMKDPRQALERMGGQKLPDDLEIVVHESTPKRLHILVPPLLPQGSLSERELEAVSGGGMTMTRECGQAYTVISCRACQSVYPPC